MVTAILSATMTVGMAAVASASYTASSGTSTSGSYNIAIGGGNSNNPAIATGGVDTIAIGSQSYVSGVNSVSVGSGNTIANTYTYVLGNNVVTTQDNSVVLGSYSTDRAATTESSATINGLTYGTFAGQGSTANGVVSVGSEGAERQIINVAAGAVTATSTDAVNGSQLYAVASNVSNVANSTVSVLGGNASLSSDGTITMSDIGGTGESTVNDAIQSVNDKVNGITSGYNKLDNQIDKVGARAAALAGLHPIDYDPNAKWNFAGAYGNYNSENAFAIGAFYRPTEDVMFSVASSLGSGDCEVITKISPTYF